MDEILVDEIKLSPEEEQLQTIEAAADAEQVRVHSIYECGTPMKYMVVRSEKVGKQVLIQPEYHALKELGTKAEVIGYLRKGDTKTIQNFGTSNKLEMRITGEQRRGE